MNNLKSIAALFAVAIQAVFFGDNAKAGEPQK